MEYLDNLLRNIKAKYAVYIGRKQVHDLIVLLGGYELAVYEFTKDEKVLNCYMRFQSFVWKKNNIAHTSKSVEELLMEGRTEEEAFDLFFELWEEFRRQESEEKCHDKSESCI